MGDIGSLMRGLSFNPIALNLGFAAMAAGCFLQATGLFGRVPENGGAAELEL